MKHILINIYQRIKNIFSSKYINEDDYYEKMFVKDKEWGSIDINVDEQSRLNEFYLHFSKFKNKSKLSIVDVGAGRGWLGNSFLKFGKVVCIEPVKAVVNHGMKLYPDIKFFSCKPESFVKDNPNLKFDLLLCSEVLEHIIDKDFFVKNLTKMIKRQGFAIISTPRKELYGQWMKKNGLPPQPVEEWLTTSECINLFESNGFSHIFSSNAFDMDIYQVHSFKKV